MKHMMHIFNYYPTKLLLLIAAYFIAGKLLVFLDIPGFVFPFWPASGIALAVTLIGGYRYLPGVFLGMLATTLTDVPYAENMVDIPIPHLLLIATVIAFGAVLQACAGTFLIRHAIPSPTIAVLNNEKEMGLLLILGGPASAIVNATTITTILLITGYADVNHYVFDWITQWIAEILGVLVVTPVIVLLATSKYTINTKAAVCLPLLFILAIVISLFLYVNHAEKESTQQSFAKHAAPQIAGLKGHFQTYEEILRSIGKFFATSPYITQETFSAFTQDALEKYSYIQALEWIPRVSLKEKKLYETQARKNGYPEFRIIEQSKDGMIAVEPREEYFPVYYVEPYKNNETVLGFDVFSDPKRVRALEDSRDSGKPIATESIDLLQEIGDQKGFLMFYPVYNEEKPVDTVEERREHLKGFVLGVFRIGDTVNSVVEDVSEKLAYIHIFDNYIRGSAATLYGTPDLDAVFSYPAVMEVARRQWTLEFTPTELFLEQNRGWQAWTALIGGLLFMSLVQIFLLSTTARAEVIKQQVDEKTLELSKSNSQLDSILTMAPNGILSVDQNGAIQSCNRVIEDIFGYTSQELIGKAIETLIPKSYQKQHVKNVSDYLLHGQKKKMAQGREVPGISKQGNTIPLEVALGPINLADGSVQVIATVQDITERKKAEADREQLIEHLRQSNEELDKFAYVASHDLKAPLRVIDNASRWLEEDLKDLDDESKENMELLRSRVARMEKLLDDLLEYSRIGRKINNKYEEIISGKALLDDVLALLSPPKAFKVEVDDTFKNIQLNRMPLQQIFLNLISNALKHHDKDTGRIDVTVEDKGDWYQFSISDDGPGIAKEFQQKVFEMFQTLKPRDRVEGSGMGLAMVKKHIEHFGGILELESEEGEGCTFRFTWPKQQINTAEKEAA